MSNPLLLLLRLEGPLQSWGERARWDYRDTTTMPTKSGIIGLLACASGISRNAPILLEMDKKLSTGVRMDRPGQIITDYHTISGTIRTAEGKQRGAKDEESTLQSYRQYLQDAAFFVVVSGDETLLVSCAERLRHPIWPVFLGRKSCVPTRPVYEDLTTDYSSLTDALSRHSLSKLGTKEGPVLCELEDQEGDFRRRDRITNIPARIYHERRIKIFTVSPPREVIA